MRQHPQAGEILARLKKEGIYKLYHFTSVENLPGISRFQGLCSKQFLDSKNAWPVPQPGGNQLSHDLDRSKGNWDLVSLTYTPHTPMAYRKKSASHLCFLEISRDVALREGVVFTDSNAAGNSAQKRGEGTAGLDLVNFSMVKSSPLPWSQDWVHLSQAEVLVPGCIDLESIRQVVFVSSASQREGQQLWGNNGRPEFVVDRVPFANYPNSPDNIDFSHVSEVYLLDSEITKDTAWQVPRIRNRFKKKPKGVITALIEARALGGTIGRVKWNPVVIEDKIEFEKSNTWRWWPHIPISKLPLGHCSIEIWLNDIKWSTMPFEMVA
jgi:hypothetical protein